MNGISKNGFSVVELTDYDGCIVGSACSEPSQDDLDSDVAQFERILFLRVNPLYADLLLA